ncbi:hypothetical protein Nmel_013463 [Mimus melanotis]
MLHNVLTIWRFKERACHGMQNKLKSCALLCVVVASKSFCYLQQSALGRSCCCEQMLYEF